MRPNIEPWGIPDKRIWKALSVSLIFTYFFLYFKYGYTKVTASSDKPCAWSFALLFFIYYYYLYFKLVQNSYKY